MNFSQSFLAKTKFNSTNLEHNKLSFNKFSKPKFETLNLNKNSMSKTFKKTASTFSSLVSGSQLKKSNIIRNTRENLSRNNQLLRERSRSLVKTLFSKADQKTSPSKKDEKEHEKIKGGFFKKLELSEKKEDLKDERCITEENITNDIKYDIENSYNNHDNKLQDERLRETNSKLNTNTSLTYINLEQENMFLQSNINNCNKSDLELLNNSLIHQSNSYLDKEINSNKNIYPGNQNNFINSNNELFAWSNNISNNNRFFRFTSIMNNNDNNAATNESNKIKNSEIFSNSLNSNNFNSKNISINNTKIMNQVNILENNNIIQKNINCIKIENNESFPVKEYRNLLSAQFINEYGDNLIIELKKEELFYLNPTLSSNINIRMRSKMIDWMIEVLSNYKSDNNTFFIAISLLDRFLLRNITITPDDLHLVGVTCMFIASKVNDLYPIKMKLMIDRVSHGKFVPLMLFNMEEAILKAIDYNINSPSTYEFLNLYIDMIFPEECNNFYIKDQTLSYYLNTLKKDLNNNTYNFNDLFEKFKLSKLYTIEFIEFLRKVCIYISKLNCFDPELVGIKPSLLAAGSLYVSVKICEQVLKNEYINERFTNNLIKVSNSNKQEIFTISQKILYLAQNFDEIYKGLENLKKMHFYDLESSV